ncbi:pyrokinin-1 receptor-like [Condylostylus longicornis]|uniref:pyrokinin-1 receptor-like n=1 Tax=Condylostylus longicornis TaxID=2530218 RepID=UPI00244DC8AE|nr:pyrokinin-1 receptor-like [Condylostylus longicornis]
MTDDDHLYLNGLTTAWIDDGFMNLTITSNFSKLDNYYENNVTTHVNSIISISNSDNIINVSSLSNISNNIIEFPSPTIIDSKGLVVNIFMTIIYSTILLSGIIGNIITCIVIKRHRSMHTATNYYLFSLAISDFLLLISGAPHDLYYVWFKDPYEFGEVFCVTRGLLAETAANATVLTITAFTVERYVAICHPFLSHSLSKLNRVTKVILLIWLTSLLTAAPLALQFGVIIVYGVEMCVIKRIWIEHAFAISTILFFFFPMSIIFVLYLLIGLKLHQTNLKRTRNGHILCRVNTNMTIKIQNQQGRKRVIKMLVAVVIAFFLCWAPFHAQRLFTMYVEVSGLQTNFFIHIYEIITYISGVMYYLSTCINPFLYNIMSHKFREAFRTVLFRQRSNSSSHPGRQPSTPNRKTTLYSKNSSDFDYNGENKMILQAVLKDETVTNKLLFESSSVQ